MDYLADWLFENLPDPELGWKVLHKLKADSVKMENWEVSIKEKGANYHDLPFNFHPGYLVPIKQDENC